MGKITSYRILIKRKRNKCILIWRYTWRWFPKNMYTKKTIKLPFSILECNLSKFITQMGLYCSKQLETTCSSILWKPGISPLRLQLTQENKNDGTSTWRKSVTMFSPTTLRLKHGQKYDSMWQKRKLHHSKSRRYERESSFCVSNAQQFSFFTLTAM